MTPVIYGEPSSQPDDLENSLKDMEMQPIL
jgi:hypothetical protein